MTVCQYAEDNMRLARFVINKYFPTYNNDEDFLSEAYLGLVKAANNYDPTSGVQFSTFAVKCIYSYLKRYIQYMYKCKPAGVISLEDAKIGDQRYEDTAGGLDSDIECMDFSVYDWADTLLPSQRYLFDLLLAEKSVEEIAQIKGTSRQSVYKQRNRLKRDFEKYMNRQGEVS